MKTFITISVLAVFFLCRLDAQKVDIDNYRIYISNAKLPTNYVPVDKRTYNVKVSGNWNNSDLAESISVPGWDRTNENPSLELSVKIDPMSRGNSSLKSRLVENKDKNGKVTSSTTYYSVSATNSGNARLMIYGVKNELKRPLSKKELEKKEKKEKEKKEKEASNPFLANVDTKNVNEESNVDTKNQLAYNISLSENYTYTTNESTSSSAATKEFNLNSSTSYQNHMNEFIKHVVNSATNQTASLYSYTPVKNWVKFKELDSEKHPEYEMYSNATKALKTIFTKMRYNKSVDEIVNDLTPIIKYFDALEQKYVKDDKHEKRLRAATLFNLATIFQYLDRHDKAIELANKMISLDLEKGDAEVIIEDSQNIKKQLEFHNMTSRHIVPRNEAEKAENEGSAEETEELKP